MGKGKPLSDVERGKILAFSSVSMSHREIARRMNRSAKPGRVRALTERGRRRLFGEARKTGSCAKTIQKSLQLDASVRTTQRELQNNDLFEYVKRNHTTKVTPEHKKGIEWAKTMLKERTDWSSIIFSDEKKFNPDDPPARTPEVLAPPA
uniref:AlNc14C76G5081 protein n=1 Tax=Albugo laibachii Nc14 TaxID=890382 RepID=F0WEN1_9STRA|nr:AlNc14C76G5081 [Albugo laibachii Nc14]|eukprot:CCA19663.1 AlNc14C76G5081 [Albugo laibachii Nc14]